MMNCKICNSQNLHVYLDNPTIFECGDCKISFRPSNHQMKDIYSIKIPMPDFFASRIRNWHHINFIENNIGFKNIKSILEIGSGDGSLIRQIRDNYENLEITIIEPGTFFCDKLSKVVNITIINDYIENVNRLNKNYDLIIMSHVLEHLEDPKKTLQLIFDNFLNKNNYLYIDIPNKDYELRSVQAARVAPSTHLFFFDGIGIKNLMADIGFKNISGNKYSTLPVGFINRLEKIGNIENNSMHHKLILKVLNRFSLYTSELLTTIFKRNPSEIKLEDTDFKFNNIAIIAKK